MIGSSHRTAAAHCWGTTPFPRSFNESGRERPGTRVTQPAGRPINHSTNLGGQAGLAARAGLGRIRRDATERDLLPRDGLGVDAPPIITDREKFRDGRHQVVPPGTLPTRSGVVGPGRAVNRTRRCSSSARATSSAWLNSPKRFCSPSPTE